MSLTSRSPIDPYAVDNVENPSKDGKSVASNYQNGAYSNLGYAPSQENLSRNLVSTSKGNFANPSYENTEFSDAHTYDDPTFLTGSAKAANTGGRRKRNELYEPTELKAVDGSAEKADAEKDGYPKEISDDSWLSRLVLFLILLISLTSLLLVALIIQGQIGTGCSSQCNEEPAAAESSRGAFSSSTDPTDTATLQAPPDVSSLENMIKDLRGNISSIRTYMDKLPTGHTKDQNRFRKHK
ncbi:PREDICTED: uncharacterized protein LOC107346275 isoform X1 [Acropora digitifera]|uniref:uncharacterized protein LOC107346275 isoform X1 n=1 Tax=Acropora digitifera TaxID=70779 RepID=UPI00077A9568|nr:PREDICTED: uncharacterized protein LOC107346275 isoform X1 [Acropora digitifera]